MSSAEWAATSPRSAGFSAVGKCSDVQGLSNLHKELRTRGQGYIEVRLPTGKFPLLTMGFRGNHAVIHLFQDAETGSLLVGDGSVAAHAVIDVPIMDEEAVFTGHFALSADHAWDLMQHFAETGEPHDLGEWCEL
ncbi:hypothetical protein [Streptomyces sp. NPDC004675]|uniref:hypothetical protein n=1 Tax=unclassified Streptomyces TaxID=2593676 RepID=UPI0033A50440